MKLFTPVEPEASKISISPDDRVFVLGSCFADAAGARLRNAGFDVCVNPFGTLYNPLSVKDAVERLSNGNEFTPEDCVEMGAGAGLICSFHHHTSFAKAGREEFLANANRALRAAHEEWAACNKVIISLGTVRCWFHDGKAVSNCLKLPQEEFVRKALNLDETVRTLEEIVRSCPDKEFIFTVSPIRHMADGAHANQASKSTLILAVDEICRDGRCGYFPAYEILLDELRDYRFYAEDLCHPSNVAEQIIWERFVEYAVPHKYWQRIADALKAWRRSQHRPIH